MRKVGQVRFQGGGTGNNQVNYPPNLTTSDLVSGNAFTTIKGKIIQLGIQTIPGVKFRLNKSLQWLTVGNTGIYDLELDGQAEIVSLSFNNESMGMLQTQGGYLIVDYIYEEEES